VDAPIEVSVGETFDIALPTIAAAGYSWRLQKSRERDEHVELVTETWDSPSRGVGNTSQQHFRFRAIAPGTISLQFAHGRSWETKPIETRDIALEIKPSAKGSIQGQRSD